MARMNPPMFRALFRAIPLDKRCSPTCPGWACGPSGVARCDECWAYYTPAARPTDADAAALPEAQQRARLLACDNCGARGGVRPVSYDTMVDGPGATETVELCRECRGGP